jgi:hypothetical protein
MAAAIKVGKTHFIEEILDKDPKANASRINQAWNDAGHTGSISTSLVQRLRAAKGLTRKSRRQSKASSANGSAKSAKVPGRKPGRPPKAATVGSTRVNGTHAPVAAGSKPAPSQRARLLDELEGEIDRLIFRIIGLGDLAEVEGALRRARRILVLSHQG